jgi:hypothetical protein
VAAKPDQIAIPGNQGDGRWLAGSSPDWLIEIEAYAVI